MFVIVNVFIIFEVASGLRKSVNEAQVRNNNVTCEVISQFFAGKVHTIALLSQYKPILDYLKQCKNAEDAKNNPNYASIVEMFNVIESVYISTDDIYSTLSSPPDEIAGVTAWLAGIQGNYLLTPRGIMDENSADVWVTKERPWYEKIEHFNGISYSDIYIDMEFNQPCVSIITKVSGITPNETPIDYGVIGLDIFLKTVLEIMERASKTSSGKIILIDGTQTVVYHPDIGYKHDQKLADIAGHDYASISEILNTKYKEVDEGSELMDIGGVKTYVNFSRVRIPNTRWFVITLVPRSVAEESLNSYLVTILIISAVDLFLFALPIIFVLYSEQRRTGEIEKMRDIAIESSKAKSGFLANMSHEIRTPMNGVVGMTDILLHTPPLSSLQRQYVNTIRQSAESLLAVINDILDFSKIEAGQFKLEEMDVHLRNIIEESCEVVAIRIHEKGLYFASDISPEIRGIYKTDGTRIRQIMLNLLGNAAKFTTDGMISVRVYPDEIYDGVYGVRFEVKDTGIGIPSDKQDLIFTPFTQAEVSTTRRFGGTGLGLSICLYLVKQMGGEIGVKSEVGNGSTFWFTLPIQQFDMSESSMVENRYGSGQKLLVYEVFREGIESVLNILQYWGFQVTFVDNHNELVENMRKESPDLILYSIDVNKNKFDDFQAEFQSLREKNRRAKLIIMFSLGDKVASSIENINGMVGVISKPMRLLTLEELIRKAIGHAKIVDRPHEYIEFGNQEPCRILLVEDVQVNVIVARVMLESLGHKIDVAENGVTALEMLSKNDYDIVFMDCQMPVMDGYECTQKIRDPKTNVKNHGAIIIAMTANAMDGDRDRCIEAGMNDYISKPITRESVIRTIGRWCGKDKK
jgi:signal transduction histidine kinase/DNA-binding response OmpR family regulator